MAATKKFRGSNNAGASAFHAMLRIVIIIALAGGICILLAAGLTMMCNNIKGDYHADRSPATVEPFSMGHAGKKNL